MLKKRDFEVKFPVAILTNEMQCTLKRFSALLTELGSEYYLY